MTQKENRGDAGLYEFASLSGYGIRQRIFIRVAGYLLYLLIALIGWSVRIEPMRGWSDPDNENSQSFESQFEKMRRSVIAFWHDRILLTTFYFRGDDAAVMVSKSLDGEYMTRTAQRFGYGVVRGSSSRAGASALIKMIRLTSQGIRMALTVDGPRGPRHKAKRGAIVLARDAGVPVIPVSAEVRSAWILKNWDRTVIPKPFSRAVVFVGEPVIVPEDADKVVIEEKRRELERKLDELATLGKEWRVAKQ